MTPGFFRGLRFPWEGWTFLRAHPQFWRYTYAPVILNGLVSLLVLGGFAWGAWELSALAREWIPERRWWSLLARGLFYLGLVGLSLGLVVGTSMVLSSVVNSVFQGLLAEKIERFLGTPASELPGLSIPQEIGEAVLTWRDLVLGTVALGLLNLVPGVGSLFAGVLGWYWNAYTLGLETLDFPWALRGRKRREKRALARRYRGETVGVGTVALTVGWIPFVGAFILSLSVVGSVLWNKQRPK